MNQHNYTAGTSAVSASLRGNGKLRTGEDALSGSEKQVAPGQISMRSTMISVPMWWSFERLCEAMDLKPNHTARRRFDMLEANGLLVRAPGFQKRQGRPRRYTAESCLRVLTGNV